VTQPIHVQENLLIDQQLHWQILQVPPAGGPISDYHTSNIQALGFPTLFPYGVGDFFNHDHLVNSFPMKDVSRYHRFYCIAKEDGTFHYPFVQHECWPYWVQNTWEFHSFQQEKTMVLKKLPNQITGMTMGEFNELLEQEILSKCKNFDRQDANVQCQY
jgi:hypothetical protein